MHSNQRQRLVQQIAIMMRLSQPAVSTTLDYYRQFCSQATGYSNQIIVGASIYLAAKVFEDQRKIRDILNTISSAISLYKLASDQCEGYIDLSKVPKQGLYTQIQPNYDLNKYNDMKKKVLQAEQQLLRILKFDFKESEVKSQNFKQLLALCDTLGTSNSITQIAINTFNDLQFTNKVKPWIPGILYFSYEVHQCRQQQIQTQNQQIEWQKIFLVSLKTLQAYSSRVIQYYESLSAEEHEQDD